jgi:hypothetical protein
VTILDANGLIHCLDKNKPLPEQPLVVTEDLREEYETALVVNGHRKLALQDISELPGYDEGFYLKEYARYLNTFSGVDLSGMRGITDASILALASCLLNDFGGAQQTHLDLGEITETKLTVISNDGGLTRRLVRDFGDGVIIIDPTSL